MKNKLLVGVVALLAAAGIAYHFTGDAVPPHQPALATLDAGSLEKLRARFNAAAGETRIIVLLSPT